MLLSSHMEFQFTLKLYSKEGETNDKEIYELPEKIYFSDSSTIIYEIVFSFLLRCTSLFGYTSTITIGDFLYIYLVVYI
jgi:hypothetical protein